VADALNVTAVQVLLQPLRRRPSAWPLPPVARAHLVRFGLVDPLKANVFAVDHDRVAVDDTCRTSDIGVRRDCCDRKYDSEGNRWVMP
jgi:hypothetical protein